MSAFLDLLIPALLCCGALAAALAPRTARAASPCDKEMAALAGDPENGWLQADYGMCLLLQAGEASRNATERQHLLWEGEECLVRALALCPEQMNAVILDSIPRLLVKAAQHMDGEEEKRACLEKALEYVWRSFRIDPATGCHSFELVLGVLAPLLDPAEVRALPARIVPALEASMRAGLGGPALRAPGPVPCLRRHRDKLTRLQTARRNYVAMLAERLLRGEDPAAEENPVAALHDELWELCPELGPPHAATLSADALRRHPAYASFPDGMRWLVAERQMLPPYEARARAEFHWAEMLTQVARLAPEEGKAALYKEALEHATRSLEETPGISNDYFQVRQDWKDLLLEYYPRLPRDRQGEAFRLFCERLNNALPWDLTYAPDTHIRFLEELILLAPESERAYLQDTVRMLVRSLG